MRLPRPSSDLYEQFRPEVPSDELAWGDEGLLDVAKIRATPNVHD